MLQSFALFILIGLSEIGGGYFVFQWLREGKSLWVGIIGGLILALYGIIAIWPTARFRKTYAVYGGIFIILAVLWACIRNGFQPDHWDVIGALAVLTVTCIIVHLSRRSISS